MTAPSFGTKYPCSAPRDMGRRPRLCENQRRTSHHPRWSPRPRNGALHGNLHYPVEPLLASVTRGFLYSPRFFCSCFLLYRIGFKIILACVLVGGLQRSAHHV